jgi:putative NADH-flavin reductase
MKLLILGVTGSTGLQIVSQAIERGHSVTAFVRTPDALKRFGDRIAVIQGNLLNSSELSRVLKGHDAVLSGFGPRLPVSTQRSPRDLGAGTLACIDHKSLPNSNGRGRPFYNVARTSPVRGLHSSLRAQFFTGDTR